MTRPGLDEIAEYVLGTLPDARRRELDGLCARSTELRREVAAVRESMSALPAAIASVRPRKEARDALLHALGSSDRFRPFLDDLARHFDLATTRVRELFAQIDDATRWEPGPMPGISLMHFAAGPNAVAPDTGFVRFPRGLHFPKHRHVGHEVNYVLEGGIRDGDGTLYLPGEALVMTPDSVHEFFIPEEADALVAVVQAGFELV